MTAATSRLSTRPIVVRRLGVSPQPARASPRRSVEFLIRAPISSEITRCPSKYAGQAGSGRRAEGSFVDGENSRGDFRPGIVASRLLPATAIRFAMVRPPTTGRWPAPGHVGFFGGASNPSFPFVMTLRYPGMSPATTALPEAIASSSTIPKLSPDTDGAQNRSQLA